MKKHYLGEKPKRTSNPVVSVPVIIPQLKAISAARFDPVRRFWKSVCKAGEDDCWTWLSWKNKKGYGRLKIRGVEVFAHRLSFTIHKGALLPGECVLHSCDNPSCVNPKHLRKGNRIDNNDDRAERGRNPKGEQSAVAKLTNAAVSDIRANYRYRKVPLGFFATKYETGTSTIWNALTNKTYKG